MKSFRCVPVFICKHVGRGERSNVNVAVTGLCRKETQPLSVVCDLSSVSPYFIFRDPRQSLILKILIFQPERV